MSIKSKKSDAIRFLEGITGGPLTFGKLLEAIRLGEEVSQVQFAKKLGISKAHLCDLEKGRRSVSPGRAAKFAKALAHSPERFVKLCVQDQLDEAGLKLRVEIEAA
jgi:transcriptional regulator with XRE-family HTH domain